MTLRISLVLSLMLFVFGFINAQDVQWLKSINGLADDEGFGMTVNESGNPVCCGYFNSDTIFFGSMFLNNHSEQANAADAFVIKYDLNGNPLWADNPGSSGHEKAWNVASDSENNIYLTGGFEGSFYFGSSSLESENLMDGMLLKYDASGNELWGVEISSLGQVEPRWIECDTEGNIIVSGRFYNHPLNIEDTTIANHNSLDIFMLKFNGEGELLWARSYGGYDDDYVMGMCTDLADNIYFTGGFHSSSFTLGNFQFSSSSSVRAAVIAQLDPDGDVIWAECHDDSYDQQFMGIDVDSSFNIYTSGYFKDLFNFGPYAIYANYGGFDVFLAKYNSNHEHQWIQKISSSAYERTDKLIVDNQGNVIIEVQTYGLLQIGDTTLPHNGGYDIVLAKFEPDGSLFWALHANGNADERAIEMAIGPFENFYTTGYFRSNQLAIGQEQINNKGMADAFISSIGPDCLPPYPAFNFVIDTLSVQFTSIGSADNYLWDFGDGDTSSLINPTHEYDTAGIYNVCLTVSNICGQEISCQDVTICIAPEAEFVAYAVDLEVSFYQLSQLAVDYYWDFGDGSYSTEAEPVHIYPAHDIYIATLTVINECGSDIHIDTLILAPPMMCNFSFVVENGIHFFTI